MTRRFVFTKVKFITLMFVMTFLSASVGFWSGLYTGKSIYDPYHNIGDTIDSVDKNDRDYFINNSEDNLEGYKLDIPEGISKTPFWSDESYNLYVVYTLPGGILQIRDANTIISRAELHKRVEEKWKFDDRIINHSKLEPDSILTGY